MAWEDGSTNSQFRVVFKQEAERGAPPAAGSSRRREVRRALPARPAEGAREGAAVGRQAGRRRGPRTLRVGPQPGEGLWVSARAVGASRGAKASVSAGKAPEVSDAPTQTELVRKETSVQTVSCDECPDPSPGEKESTRKRCARVGDLLCQAAGWQETVERLHGVRGAEMEVDRWFQNRAPVVDTAENAAPWTLVTHKSRTLLRSPPSSITAKNRYEALTAVDTHEQGLRGETVPAAHSGYRKKKRRVLVVGDSLLRGTEVPICRPDRES
ncbi:uncharacterized protein LOC115339276 [Aquila chrysaetos chrysaetos]|uniref:uncharacterized protein LOC115339276 n=1 Tax=Aquila chrysaetos chrysaetos TaxID=223781 RepID=UPI001176A601|nr:uncharacterized protein LOC115339276 [Aquila chrysaetos chrysaetos]